MFRTLFINCHCKSPLFSPAPYKMQSPPYGWRIGVTCPGLHSKLQEGETDRLGFAVFSENYCVRVKGTLLI